MISDHNRHVDAVLAPRASTHRRQWWAVVRASPAVLCTGVGLALISGGEWALGVMSLLVAINVIGWTVAGLSLFRYGYARGSLQCTLDHIAHTPHEVVQARRSPHPADPTPPLVRTVVDTGNPDAPPNLVVEHHKPNR